MMIITMKSKSKQELAGAGCLKTLFWGNKIKTDEVEVTYPYGKKRRWHGLNFDFRRVLKRKRLDFSSLSFLIRFFTVLRAASDLRVYVLQKVFHRIHVCVFLKSTSFSNRTFETTKCSSRDSFLRTTVLWHFFTPLQVQDLFYFTRKRNNCQEKIQVNFDYLQF